MTTDTWIPAFAGMTTDTWIPAFAEMTNVGWIPAFAGMTAAGMMEREPRDAVASRCVWYGGENC